MYRSTTIIMELAIQPGKSHIDMKTFSKVMSLIIMQWCGSMFQYGMCAVYCVLCIVYCVLCTVCCVLCAVYCVLCTVLCNN